MEPSSVSRQLLPVLLLATTLGLCRSICVLDNKKGWWLDCGLRDSYLFRIKDFGGITARFDFALGLGDEQGFPHSIGNTNGKNKGGHHPPYHPPPAIVIPPFHGQTLYSRSSDGAQKRASPLIRPPTHYGDNSRSAERRSSTVMRRPMKRPLGPRGKNGKLGPMGQRRYHPPFMVAQNGQGMWVKVPAGQMFRNGQQTAMVPFRPHVPTGDAKRSYASSRPIERQSHEPPQHERHQVPEDSVETSLWQDLRQTAPHTHVSQSDESWKSALGEFRSPPPLPEPKLKPLPERYTGPMIGDVLGSVLQLPASTPADSDHVPSFASQLLVVRDAPNNFHPPGYNNSMTEHFTMITKLPRTKFFCEEQEFLPGLYADVQLGCKIFHLCVPAPLGCTVQSYLCPNSTLFDQSILMCNFWELVDCSQSYQNYDANQPLALSYRRVNAAHLPVEDVHDPLTLSLLSDIRTSDTQP